VRISPTAVVTVGAIATPSPKSESAVEVVSEPKQEDPEVTLRAKEQQLEEKMKVRHCKPLNHRDSKFNLH